MADGDVAGQLRGLRSAVAEIQRDLRTGQREAAAAMAELGSTMGDSFLEMQASISALAERGPAGRAWAQPEGGGGGSCEHPGAGGRLQGACPAARAAFSADPENTAVVPRISTLSVPRARHPFRPSSEAPSSEEAPSVYSNHQDGTGPVDDWGAHAAIKVLRGELRHADSGSVDTVTARTAALDGAGPVDDRGAHAAIKARTAALASTSRPSSIDTVTDQESEPPAPAPPGRAAHRLVGDEAERSSQEAEAGTGSYRKSYTVDVMTESRTVSRRGGRVDAEGREAQAMASASQQHQRPDVSVRAESSRRVTYLTRGRTLSHLTTGSSRIDAPVVPPRRNLSHFRKPSVLAPSSYRGSLGTTITPASRATPPSSQLSTWALPGSRAVTRTPTALTSLAGGIDSIKKSITDDRWKALYWSATDSSSLSDHALRSAGIFFPRGTIAHDYEAPARRRASAVVQSPCFDTVVGTIVAVNAICIGIELQMSLDGDVPGALLSLEAIFLCFYVFELMLRLFAEGLQVCKKIWFLLDGGLVVTGVVALTAQLSGAQGYSAIDVLLIFRSLRIFRVIRAIRVLEFFQELWRLFSGLIQSCRTVLAAFMLVILVVYMFACVGLEIVTKSHSLNANADTKDIIDEYFDSVFSFMLTLVQFANADSVSLVYMPIVKQEPALAIYFLVLMLVVTVICMNLVTASIVQTVFKMGKDDKDLITQRIRAQTKKFLPLLAQVFEDIDTEKDGELELRKLEESIAMFQGLKLPASLARILEPSTLQYAFELMDDDGNGKVNLSEFVSGVFGFAYTEVPLETSHMIELLRRQRADVQGLKKQGEELCAAIKIIGKSVEEVRRRRT